MVQGVCPVAHDFDLLAPEHLRDPYPLMARLREEGPAFYVPELDHYIVTRYSDIEHVLMDRETFSAANASSPLTPPADEARRILEAGYRRVPTLNNADPPRHGPMRKAVLQCMSPRRLVALEPTLRKYAQGLIDNFVQEPVVDLVSSLAFPLPAFAAFSLLGFPVEDTDMLKEWCYRRVLFTYGKPSIERQIEGAEAMVAFWSYVERFVDARLNEPADDLTSDLLHKVHAKHPETVTVEDIVNMVYSMALAGHETTTNLIGNGLRQLFIHRDQWDALCADGSLIPNAVEEALRFEGPVVAHRRMAKVDTEIGGVPLPAGAKVMMLFASAGRDESVFEHPDAFDVRRDNAELHLAFGKGPHLCLGAPLARMEMVIVLELLTDQTPNMALVADRETDYVPNVLFRTPQHVWVRPQG
jgi:cytochrome P450